MNDISLYEKVPLLENKFTVKFRQYTSIDNLPVHWHEHVEVMYVLSGKGTFVLNGKVFDIKSDDFVVVNHTQIHSFTASESLDFFSILIYPEFFSDVNFSNCFIQNHIQNDVYIKDCMIKMNDEYVKNIRGSDMMLKSYAYELMAYLVRRYTAFCLSGKEADLYSAKMKRITEIFSYISEHYHEKITTRQLADLSFLSESYFCRFFKSAVGKSVTEYINEYRIEKAAVMLLNTDASITSIAADTGFDDMNYFSRIFKKFKKVTPVNFRKGHQP